MYSSFHDRGVGVLADSHFYNSSYLFDAHRICVGCNRDVERRGSSNGIYCNHYFGRTWGRSICGHDRRFEFDFDLATPFNEEVCSTGIPRQFRLEVVRIYGVGSLHDIASSQPANQLNQSHSTVHIE